MTTLELIQSELVKLPEEKLDELYRVIRDFAASQAPVRNGGIMTKLRQIRIEAPADFAANLDRYLSGEKSVDADIH